MLLNIHVKNMALIQEIDIDLGKGLNILTGETGAGKSIMIGSINVALGAQSFKGFMKEGAKEALVELVFAVEQEKQLERLKQMDIPVEEDQVIITRRMVNGRSISKINGETVPVSAIRRVAELLIDIHGQHEHQSLLNQKNHLGILDDFAKEKLKPCREKNRKLCQEYRELLHKMEETRMDEVQRVKEMDFLRFEIQEIDQANLILGEDEELEAQFRKLSNGKRMIGAAAECHALTSSGQPDAGELIGHALRSLAGVMQYDKQMESLHCQLADIDNLLNDFNRELSDYMNSLSFEEKDFLKLEERLNLLNRLKEKYGSSISEILAYKQEKEERLSVLEDYETYRVHLQQELSEREERFLENCGRISKIRQEEAIGLTDHISQALKDLNFSDIRFSIQFEKSSQPGPEGYDQVCFLISTNPGEELRPLQEVASGGELSRIMLGIKAVMADKDATETLIFDEIDVGISGRTAQKVSEKLAVIAKGHQVICITHLAQIASMADSHFIIEKKVEKQGTVTSIRSLQEEESTQELARILGGAEITETVLKSAKEMKELAACTKKY